MRTIRELIGDTIREFFHERDVKKEIMKLMSPFMRKGEVLNGGVTPNKKIRVTIGGEEYDIAAQLVTTTTTTSTTTTTTAAPSTTTTTTL